MTTTGTPSSSGPTTPSASATSSVGRYPTPTSASSAGAVGGATIKPKFGAVFDGRVVWVGGSPNHDLSDTNATEMASPQCLCGLDPKTHVSMYKDQALNGNDIKFKKDDKDYNCITFYCVAAT